MIFPYWIQENIHLIKDWDMDIHKTSTPRVLIDLKTRADLR